MATRELLRRPRSFLVPAGILLLLALLLLYPSAILDGLTDSTTGALRTAPADLIVYSEDAKSSLLRSRVGAATRDLVAGVEGVEGVAPFDVMLLGALTPDGGEPVGLAVLASEWPLGPEVPGPGQAYADAILREAAGISVGDTLVVGPLSVPVEVVGFTHDTNLFFQSGLVVDQGTWRQMMGQPPEPGGPGDLVAGPGDTPSPGALPGAGPAPTSPAPPTTGTPASTATTSTAVSTATTPTTGGAATTATTTPPGSGPGGTGAGGTTAPGTTAPGGEGPQAAPGGEGPTTQALLVRVAPGADPLVVADAVDDATGGETDTITPAEAIRSLPGMTQQQTTFGAIRIVTLGVALVVVGLFLSFMTLERTPLYAVLKALGMSSRQLFTGVVIQVLMVTISAALAAAAVTWALTQVPLELPTTMRPIRFAETLGALSVTSVVGSILSLRRVVRVDPASAIG